MSWQKTNHTIELMNSAIFNQKREYILDNPVEAGIVSEPENYVYSSANPLSRIKSTVA